LPSDRDVIEVRGFHGRPIIRLEIHPCEVNDPFRVDFMADPKPRASPWADGASLSGSRRIEHTDTARFDDPQLARVFVELEFQDGVVSRGIGMTCSLVIAAA
jgi:hypothetical protein